MCSSDLHTVEKNLLEGALIVIFILVLFLGNLRAGLIVATAIPLCSYPGTLTLKDALAQSPNTTFVKLIEQVTVPTVVDLAVKLGMRSYAKPGT